MRRVLSGVVVAACVVAVITAPGMAAAAGPGWSVVPTPNPAGTAASELAGVACSGAGACTAVGEFDRGLGQSAALAERWNGTAFTIQPVPSPASGALSGVSCPAPAVCTAVGGHTAPGPNGGVNTLTLAERWDGTAWSVQPTPSRSNATGVTIDHLAGVSCPTASACIAVGFYQIDYQSFALAERWNGTTWSLQPIPSPYGAGTTTLNAVSCTAATACTAVGVTGDNDRPLAERWNGSAWSIQPVPTPAGEGGELDGVSCTAATACTAVGLTYRTGHPGFTLAERWNGTTWSIQSTPNPPGSTVATLSTISCLPAGACTAVGNFYNQAGNDVTLAEHWDGASWSIQPTPSPGSGANVLSTVACSSAVSCLAAGIQFGAHSFSALGERFSG